MNDSISKHVVDFLEEYAGTVAKWKKIYTTDESNTFKDEQTLFFRELITEKTYDYIRHYKDLKKNQKRNADKIAEMEQKDDQHKQAEKSTYDLLLKIRDYFYREVAHTEKHIIMCLQWLGFIR